MASGIRQIWVSMILLSAFFLCLILFAFQFIVTNNPSSSSLSDPTFHRTLTSLNSSLDAIQSNIVGIQDSVKNDKGDPLQIFLILKSMLSIPWSILALVNSSFQLALNYVFVNLFGKSYFIIMNVILAILGGIAMFVVIKWIRTGVPD
jgi:hypothetical protein